jgi:hypothetical protein
VVGKKKISAITAAVSAYMEEETQIASAKKMIPVASLWKASGRMEIMQNRTLWQRRIVLRH